MIPADGEYNLMLTALLECGRRQPVTRDVTPYTVELEQPPFSLRHYHLAGRKSGGRPLLVVYSTVNRPDLLDLSPRRSMILALLRAGLDIYVVDWGYPIDADAPLDLDDYVAGYLHACCNHIGSRHGIKAVDAAGVCQGGTLLTCYAALHPEWISTLINLAAPLDFHAAPTALAELATSIPLGDMNGLPGNVPGMALSIAFAALKPTDLLVRRYQGLSSLRDRPDLLEEFLHMESWMYDCPDQPGRMFTDFVSCFYHGNALARGELVIAGNRIRTESISARVLNVCARDDHLVPPPCTRALSRSVPAKRYREIEVNGGHLGIFLGGVAQREVIPAMLQWLGCSGSQLPD